MSAAPNRSSPGSRDPWADGSARASRGDTEASTRGAPPDEPMDAEPTPAPPALSAALSLSLGAAAVLALAAGSPLAGAAGLVALSLLASALALRSRRVASIAGAAYVLSVVSGGVTGAGPASLVAASVLAVVAWDVADHGVGLGRQVGREAVTVRNELVHAGVSLGLATAGAAVAVGGYLAASGGQPVTALVFLLVGAIALLAALR